jgi:serine phosphatase RsbU (regulator of sigma subunit)
MPTPIPENRLKRSRWLRTGYLAFAAGLVALAVLLRLLRPESDVAVLALVVAILCVLPLAALAARWTWRRLTYRVGVRLLISYLLIGVTPFALFAGLALVLGYVLVGQYTGARVASEMDQLEGRLAARVARAMHELMEGRSDRAREILQDDSGESQQGMHEEWLLAEQSREWRSPGAAKLPVPRWVAEGGWRGEVVDGEAAYLAAVERRGGKVAAMLLPLDLANAGVLARGRWYEVRLVTAVKSAPAEETKDRKVAITIGSKPGEPSRFRIDGRAVPETQVEAGWLSARPSEGSRWQRARLLWLRFRKTPRTLESGEEVKKALSVTLIKLSPRGAIQDLSGPSEKIGNEAKAMFLVLAGVFGSLNLVAVGFAAVMILRVTRSTARLTRGARAVARGDLEARIPVKRRDQLGELAVSFNAMTESVRTMLVQVAEKERMAREMELAREIQESLLPPLELSSGPLSVWAHFCPAAEVGGDYFDLFPLTPGRLVVSIGDVAGHGLPTGLLMAMVKSAVATLIEDGHRGGQLLSRLNRLLLSQNLKQRMVSFALAEVDTERREVKIASAGHQPGVLLAADGAVEEVLLSSLPLGHRWPDPAPERTLTFAPGSRLLLYSDGLVEAHDAAGNPFGYERLQEVLLQYREVGGPQLLAALLADLDRHLAGHPLGDDLTVVLVEHRQTPH